MQLVENLSGRKIFNIIVGNSKKMFYKSIKKNGYFHFIEVDAYFK